MLKSAMLFNLGKIFSCGALMPRELNRLRLGQLTEWVRIDAALKASEPERDDISPIQISPSTTFCAGLIRHPRSGAGTCGSQTAEARAHGRSDRESSCTGKRRPSSSDHCRRIC